MDRFIALTLLEQLLNPVLLKSSMDRFIATEVPLLLVVSLVLKSSMDRFIAKIRERPTLALQVFKIQYG